MRIKITYKLMKYKDGNSRINHFAYMYFSSRFFLNALEVLKYRKEVFEYSEYIRIDLLTKWLK